MLFSKIGTEFTRQRISFKSGKNTLNQSGRYFNSVCWKNVIILFQFFRYNKYCAGNHSVNSVKLSLVQIFPDVLY